MEGEENQKENNNPLNSGAQPKEETVEKEEENKDKIEEAQDDKKEEEEKKDDEKEEEKKEDIAKEEKKEEDKKVEEDNKNDKKEDEKEEGNEEKVQDDEKKEGNAKDENKKKKKKGKNKEKKNLILSIDDENNTCVDCGKNKSTKVSINNGVLICDECALEHEKLGHAISFIKDIDEDFDEYLLNFIVFGSNSKFKHFLETEKVDTSLPIEKKYLTKALFYYRKNLKNKIQSKELQLDKNYEDPNEIVEMEKIEDNYPEFEHYKIKSKVIHEGALKSKQDNKLNKLGGSLLSFGKKMYGGIKFGANYVAKKTEGPTKTIKMGAKMGAGFVGKQVSHAYEVIKKNVNKGKKDVNNKEEGQGDINKDSPPNLEKNGNNVNETGRPLQSGEEVKEEKVEAQKEGAAEKLDDSNEEKIDI